MRLQKTFFRSVFYFILSSAFIYFCVLSLYYYFVVNVNVDFINFYTELMNEVDLSNFQFYYYKVVLTFAQFIKFMYFKLPFTYDIYTNFHKFVNFILILFGIK